jgi:hypothetical protein
MARGKNADVGAERKSQNGYWYVKCEDRGDGKPGWRLKHHLVAEKKLGRKLRTDERVEIIGKKDDLSPSNVRVVEKGRGSQRRRLAQLYARRDEIQAEIDEIEETLRGPVKVNHNV